jgi:excisionase family DNA binding protein
MAKITKAQAAKILQKSERAVERYVNANPPLLSVTYEKGKTRDVPMYDESEVRALAERLKHPQTAARAVLAPDASSSQTEALEKLDSFVGIQRESADLFRELLERVVVELESGMTTRADISDKLDAIYEKMAEASVTELANKLTLSLVESSRLSGIARGHLRADIHAGKLKAKIVGRGWHIKRTDLEAYVKKL